MIKSDYHMHSYFSFDSNESPENIIQTAISLGLTHIAITDHEDFLYYDYKNAPSRDYEKFYKEFNHLKEKYAEKIYVGIGVELGLAPRHNDEVRRFMESHEFDFSIGSSHEIGLEEVYENIKSVDCFNVYGHLDYVLRYGTFDGPHMDFDRFKDEFSEMLNVLIKSGRGVEINTSGHKYGHNTSYPQIKVLKLYKELGGEIVTVGSDAHFSSFIGNKFETVPALLSAAGFSAYTVFVDKKPVWIDL